MHTFRGEPAVYVTTDGPTICDGCGVSVFGFYAVRHTGNYCTRCYHEGEDKP